MLTEEQPDLTDSDPDSDWPLGDEPRMSTSDSPPLPSVNCGVKRRFSLLTVGETGLESKRISGSESMTRLKQS